jgi:hypothetical protein
VDYSIVLGDTLWGRKGLQTRVKVAGPNGISWMSLNINGGTGRRNLNEMVVSEDSFDKLRDKLRGTYSIAKFFDEGMEVADRVLRRIEKKSPVTMDDFGYESLLEIKKIFGFEYVVYKSTDLIPQRPNDSYTWMSMFSEVLNATDYIQGSVAIKHYFRTGAFNSRGVRLWGLCFKVPEYKNLYEYDEDLSFLDMVMNVGIDRTKEVLLSPKITEDFAFRMEEFE